jgi:hypothetical protein
LISQLPFLWGSLAGKTSGGTGTEILLSLTDGTEGRPWWSYGVFLKRYMARLKQTHQNFREQRTMLQLQEKTKTMRKSNTAFDLELALELLKIEDTLLHEADTFTKGMAPETFVTMRKLLLLFGWPLVIVWTK